MIVVCREKIAEEFLRSIRLVDHVEYDVLAAKGKTPAEVKLAIELWLPQASSIHPRSQEDF